jgi:hypothetical protein
MLTRNTVSDKSPEFKTYQKPLKNRRPPAAINEKGLHGRMHSAIIPRLALGTKTKEGRASLLEDPFRQRNRLWKMHVKAKSRRQENQASGPRCAQRTVGKPSQKDEKGCTQNNSPVSCTRHSAQFSRSPCLHTQNFQRPASASLSLRGLSFTARPDTPPSRRVL